MNPEKMRNTYGKLMYLLQDSQIPEVKEMLEFDTLKPIVTVYHTLSEAACLPILRDELILAATMEITSTGKQRRQVQQEIKNKERAIEALANKYLPSDRDLIRQCLYSIGDNHAFLRVNRDPCEHLLGLLKRTVDPTHPEPNFNLAIRAGVGGARLSHDHARQYQYVLQSLSLWREIQHDMFRLCIAAFFFHNLSGFACEEDLLSSANQYRLRDTGQGLNRLQHSPRTSRLMHQILGEAQKRVGHWVGSRYAPAASDALDSVIHLGDHNVPNALMFIDKVYRAILRHDVKYTQVYRILSPLWTCLESLHAVCEADAGVDEYVQNSFGGPNMARKIIATDFFKVSSRVLGLTVFVLALTDG
ncbi:MAG: hypothetical protein SGCHY_004449 [Lobulomycetales sp.]